MAGDATLAGGMGGSALASGGVDSAAFAVVEPATVPCASAASAIAVGSALSGGVDSAAFAVVEPATVPCASAASAIAVGSALSGGVDSAAFAVVEPATVPCASAASAIAVDSALSGGVGAAARAVSAIAVALSGSVGSAAGAVSAIVVALSGSVGSAAGAVSAIVVDSALADGVGFAHVVGPAVVSGGSFVSSTVLLLTAGADCSDVKGAATAAGTAEPEGRDSDMFAHKASKRMSRKTAGACHVLFWHSFIYLAKSSSWQPTSASGFPNMYSDSSSASVAWIHLMKLP